LNQRIVELRQYTLHPGQRDVLIELFDRELVESQEATGMAVLGQFRDLDNPDRFVWLRGFPDMDSRARSLAAFYGGPVWKAHSREANATMIDSDDVLLLKPMSPGSAFPPPDGPRPPAGHTSPPESLVLATICPFDQIAVDRYAGEVRPALAAAGVPPLGCFRTEHAENTFPALPVREGENVMVWFARLPTLDHLRRIEHVISGQRLLLAPTARSLLH
jgi:NIPSNAP